ncbi:hypothetical protein ACFV16_02485 [Streptomyces massasporeus]
MRLAEMAALCLRILALPAPAAHRGVRMRGVPGEDAPLPGVTTTE